MNYKGAAIIALTGGIGDKLVLNPILESLDAYFGLVAPRRRIAVVRFDPLGRARILLYGPWFDFPANRGAKKAQGQIGRFVFRSIRASNRTNSNSRSDKDARARPEDAAGLQSYDQQKWRALLSSDADISRLAKALEPYGQKYVDELAAAYLALNDKEYLPIILSRIIESARRDIASDL